jgi:hypothetical protein
LTSICSYLYWAKLADLKLKFDPTSTDYGACNGVGDTAFYYESYGWDELWSLAAYDYLE